MRRFLNLQKRKEKKGFTLIEVLLAMSISFIGLAAAGTLLLLGYKHFYFGQNVARVQQRARIAIERMVQEFQETGVSTIDPDPSSIMNPENSSNIISFASARDDNGIFLIDENGMPDWVNAIVYFRDADSNTLYKYKEAKTDWGTNYDVSGFEPPSEGNELMATSVTGAEFWLSGDNLLNIKIKIVLNPEAENPSEEEWITAIRLRN